MSARDPLLWMFGLLVFAFAPWSLPVAWQVRRLRFAIEVDCDARVLRSGVGLVEYGHTLLAVSQRQTSAPLAALSMAARRSVLERRLSILALIRPVSTWLAGGFVALCACCLAAAAALPVPRQAVLRPMPKAQSIEYLDTTAPHSGAAAVPTRSPRQVPALGTSANARARGDLWSLGVVTATTVKVAARVDGRLVSLGFVGGKPVKAGQLLASIESPQLQAQLDTATRRLSEDRNARAEAAIADDEVAVADAQRLLAYGEVRAPISGVAGLRNVDPGNFVHAGDTLLVITQLHPIAVVFTIPEDDLPRVRTLLSSNAAPVIDLWDRTGKVRLGSGRLTAIDNEIDPATGTIKLKASVDNRAGALFPNQFVNVRLRVSVASPVPSNHCSTEQKPCR
jgi:multidrug efflux pump subunit AcrA (membrane-fusion protein)